jgi:pyruvate carboxylase subunit B
MKYVTIINNQQFEVEIEKDGTVKINGEARAVDFLSLGPALYSVITDTKSVEVVIEEEKGKYEIQMGGRLYEGMVLDERAMLMAQRRGGLTISSGEMRSPMPGLIVAVRAAEGDRVEAGQTVVILESMKMQNELKATVNGIISSVHVHAGQTVEKDTVLVNIQAE